MLLRSPRELRAKGLDPAAYDFYRRAFPPEGAPAARTARWGECAGLEAFRYGVPPHGGLGAGLGRLTARLLNLANLREATLFPRDRKRLAP